MARLLDFGRLSFEAQRFSAEFWRRVPEALFLPGLHLTDPEVIEVDTLPVSEKLVEKIKATSSRRVVEISIPPEACLTREITLPKAAVPRASAAIALQLRQTLPGGGKGLVWRSTRKAATNETVTYLACILKQKQVDALVAALTASGAKVAGLRIKGSDGAPLWSGEARKDRMRRIGLIAAVAAAFLPAAVTTGLSNRDMAAIASELQVTKDRVESLKERLVAEKVEEGDADAKRLDILQAVRSFNKQSWRLQILADLTRGLPDSVWISELAIAEDQVSLAGFSAGEVSEVLMALQSIAWVSNAQLDGPVSVDASAGESRFQVSVSIKDADPGL